MMFKTVLLHVACITIFFFFQAEDGIRDVAVTGVQTCALPISFDANDHLILIANRHFQLHRVVLLHDRARGADAGIQQALEPLIAIGGKVEENGRGTAWYPVPATSPDHSSSCTTKNTTHYTFTV